MYLKQKQTAQTYSLSRSDHFLIALTPFKEGPQAGRNLTTYKPLEHATYTTGKLASTQTTKWHKIYSKTKCLFKKHKELAEENRNHVQFVPILSESIIVCSIG